MMVVDEPVRLSGSCGVGRCNLNALGLALPRRQNATVMIGG
ncbi:MULTISPECIES: hypothetical protein [unclassified Methylobacterium]|jgi:hypothetical protein|nr:hypothetical protein [Methylobacterium sp. 2A]